MARALVKSLGNSGTGTTVIGVTVGSTGATGSTTQGITNPPGQVITGTLQDLQSGATINFSQAFGAEIGITLGAKVEYFTANVGGQTIANVVRLAHHGEIVSINTTDDGGTLLDKASGQTIPFAQVGAAESGLAQGTKVNFERIIDPNSGTITAVALIAVNA
jgi:hypothetical protein